jgi:hypothetical protein
MGWGGGPLGVWLGLAPRLGIRPKWQERSLVGFHNVMPYSQYRHYFVFGSTIQSLLEIKAVL